MSDRDANITLECSFCGAGQHRVKKLIAGPGVYVCDGCVRRGNELLEKQAMPQSPAGPIDTALAFLATLQRMDYGLSLAYVPTGLREALIDTAAAFERELRER